MTLYVDVDGTLQDYENKPRQDVIDAVRRFVETQPTLVTIWSGGGAGYAEWHARRFFPDLTLMTTAKFNPRQLLAEDIWVDDEAERIREDRYFAPKCTVLTPEEFVLWMLAQG